MESTAFRRVNFIYRIRGRVFLVEGISIIKVRNHRMWLKMMNGPVWSEYRSPTGLKELCRNFVLNNTKEYHSH